MDCLSSLLYLSMLSGCLRACPLPSMARAAQCQLCPPSVTQVMGGAPGMVHPPTPPPPNTGLQRTALSPPWSHQDGPSAPGEAAGLHPLIFPPGDSQQTGTAVGAGDKRLHGPAKRREKNDPGKSRDGFCISSGSQEMPDCPSCESQGPIRRLPEPLSVEGEVRAAVAQEVQLQKVEAFGKAIALPAAVWSSPGAHGGQQPRGGFSFMGISSSSVKRLL